MGDFFHGWRRKIGVVTLVVACVFLVTWMRSESKIDVFTVYYSDFYDHFRIVSERGFLKFHFRGIHFGPRSDLWETWVVARTPMQWEDLNIPYWSIVLVLTMLSAYLLLSKPPVAKPQSRPTQI